MSDSPFAGSGIIDLRSDTVTRPTAAMRQAMAEVLVGDDVYGEDPSVTVLQERVAALTGKESALFVPSGTMGNLSALLAHCARGREVIVGDESHIYWYEAGGASALGGLIYHPVPTQSDGRLTPDDIVAAIRPSPGNAHFAPAGVLCLENTHNRKGGRAIPATDSPAMVGVAEVHGLPVHLDGARLFNASVASGRRSAPGATRRHLSNSACQRVSARRLGRCWPARVISFTRHGGSARCLAAACDRLACWRRPASPRWTRWSSASRKITFMQRISPASLRRFRGSRLIRLTCRPISWSLSPRSRRI